MRPIRLLCVKAVTLFFLVFFALVVRAQDLGETVSQPGLFSYQAPKGWTVKDTPFTKYKVCLDAPKNKFSANINVVMEPFSGTLEKYVELNETTLKGTAMFENLQIIDQKPFVSASGVSGLRVLLTDTVSKFNLQQIFYFFNGTGDNKFVVTASCLVGDGAADAPIFDASLKTFSPK